MNSAVPETLRYADYVILNIPPPQLIKFILDYTTDDAYHRVLEELGLLFNSGVETFVRQFKKEVRAPGRAFFFDLAELVSCLILVDLLMLKCRLSVDGLSQ